MSPQQYILSTLGAATADGCDAVQFKFQGLWCRVECSRGQARVYDPRGEALTHFDIPDGVVCTLIGDLFGPPKHDVSRVLVWDCWAVGEEPADSVHVTFTSIKDLPYRDRLAFAKLNVSRIGLPFIPVKTFPIAEAQTLWDQKETILPTCGLVYRRSKDNALTTLRVSRKYPEMPGQLV